MKCYIASGWFNDQQAKDLENIKKMLDRYGFEYFSPKDECELPPTADKESKKKVFMSNLGAISHSDFIIANTRDKDMGTIFEAGYAFRCGVPIIYFCEGLTGGFNLMLAESGYYVATSLSDLTDALAAIMLQQDRKPYVGDIE